MFMLSCKPMYRLTLSDPLVFCTDEESKSLTTGMS